MARRMLIDATHPEETRVVILNGTKLDEFDFESSTKRQIKGNIYLAKVTKVEPSLQAAFVEYGGNRHGFLAFSEIHPDYYQIPVSDREAMRAAERAAEALHDPDADDDGPEPEEIEQPDQPSHELGNGHHHADEHPVADDHASLPLHDEPVEATTAIGDETAELPAAAAPAGADEIEADPADHEPAGHEPDDEHQPAIAVEADEAIPTIYDTAGDGEDAGGDPDQPVLEPLNGEAGISHIDELAEPRVAPETVGGDELEDVRSRPRVRHYRNYKIQEVIKRRQILLVQVSKEERGTKGAALTTYLSLAGRYCVLMPNAGRGGGVSRKITSAADRRRLKDLMDDLDVPEGMGVIVRTAGSERSKPEIRRDYDYLMRLWDETRTLTLRSSAPALIYEEGSLIKRAIRDLYARDIDEILVEGEAGYRAAKDLMRMLTPTHAGRVKHYRDPSIPLFHRFQVDAQIDQIHNPVVQLRSGGYIVINPTEALVSIDVNSGRATRERNIEETATKTNLEAAEEIARQLRLRDLAGLVVIDFIDMEETRNQRSVEARLKEAMKSDRARIQVGRISAFGLLELSRQRLRSSLIEASGQVCPHCNGTGTIRSTESTALSVLRAIEEEGIRRRTAEILVHAPAAIALYILNQKRQTLVAIEQRYGFSVTIARDDLLIPPAFRLDRMRPFTPEELDALVVPAAPVWNDDEEDEPDAIEAAGDPVAETSASASREDGEAIEAPAMLGEDGQPRRKRRRRRRRRSGETGGLADGAGPEALADGDAGEEGEDADDDRHEEPADAAEVPAAAVPVPTDEHSAERKRRRRGRRGGRRRTGDEAAAEPVATTAAVYDDVDEFDIYQSPLDFARDGRVDLFNDPGDPEEAPARAVERVTPPPAVDDAAPIGDDEIAAPVATSAEPEEPRKRAPRRKATGADDASTSGEPEPAASEAPKKPARRSRAKKEVEPPPTEEASPAAIIAGEPEPVPAEPVLETATTGPAPTEEDENRPRRTGWWKRLLP